MVERRRRTRIKMRSGSKRETDEDQAEQENIYRGVFAAQSGRGAGVFGVPFFKRGVQLFLSLFVP